MFVNQGGTKMLKKFTALFILPLLLFLYTGCSKKQPDFTGDLLLSNQHHISIKTETLQTRARIFYDESGAMHLLHADPQSALFGLEEIFSSQGVKSNFYQLEFESLPYFDGAGTVFQAFETVRTCSPAKIQSDHEHIKLCYESENSDFSLTLTKENCKPVCMKGQLESKSFDINFSEAA